MHYANRKVRNVDYMEGEKVLHRVSPMNGVMRFGKKGTLSLRFIGPFEILTRVGEVSYRLALSPSLARVYPVFHVSMLLKYHEDMSHVLEFITVQLDENLTYKEESVAILDRQDSHLREPVHKCELRFCEVSVAFMTRGDSAFATLDWTTSHM
ncbi:uncharacterized protein [Nicotiana tomentosiformis]|uniref:uncharacterized protein n=1 Tax=Nicotiana tomentosiformis TaxID=4098 RepID=UPI00388CD436